ncbi:MAG: dihydroorotate dehydrogenase [Candidatus Diapherotrites archaeon]|nr:dihydroorotate dehydrogenase [Candidatus Diapherotrites archaeon]
MGEILENKICGIELKNPFILASGVLGLNKETLLIAQKGGAGALTIKSITLEPREGHETPNVAFFEVGMLNAFGYNNCGLKMAVEEFSDLSCFKIPVFGSCTAGNPNEFANIVKWLDKLDFKAIELPVSCPHTPGYGLLSGQNEAKFVESVMRRCRKKTKKPIFLKISAGLPNYVEVAIRAQKAGADAIVCSNTLPGMIIDINAKSPVLSFKKGGVSGPAIRPMVVKAVYELYKELKVPIIGVGGISRGEHAIEYLMAGASAVGIATGVLQRGPSVFRKCSGEVVSWMKEHHYKNVSELVGVAHERI